MCCFGRETLDKFHVRANIVLFLDKYFDTYGTGKSTLINAFRNLETVDATTHSKLLIPIVTKRPTKLCYTLDLSLTATQLSCLRSGMTGISSSNYLAYDSRFLLELILRRNTIVHY